MLCTKAAVLIVISINICTACTKTSPTVAKSRNCDEILSALDAWPVADAPGKRALIETLKPCRNTHSEQIVNRMLKEPISGVAGEYALTLSSSIPDPEYSKLFEVNRTIARVIKHNALSAQSRSLLAASMCKDGTPLFYDLAHMFACDSSPKVRIEAYFAYAYPLYRQRRQVRKHLSLLVKYLLTEHDVEALEVLHQLIRSGLGMPLPAKDIR